MKKIIIVGAIIVLAIAAFYFGSVFKGGVSPVSPVPVANAPENQAAPAAATAPVVVTAEESTPDAIASFLLAPDAQSEVTPMEADPTLTAANDQILNDFDQSFETSQF